MSKRFWEAVTKFFSLLDSDGNGIIDIQEAHSALTICFSSILPQSPSARIDEVVKKQVAWLFQSADENKDQQITLSEFKNCYQKLLKEAGPREADALRGGPSTASGGPRDALTREPSLTGRSSGLVSSQYLAGSPSPSSSRMNNGSAAAHGHGHHRGAGGGSGALGPSGFAVGWGGIEEEVLFCDIQKAIAALEPVRRKSQEVSSIGLHVAGLKRSDSPSQSPMFMSSKAMTATALPPFNSLSSSSTSSLPSLSSSSSTSSSSTSSSSTSFSSTSSSSTSSVSTSSLAKSSAVLSGKPPIAGTGKTGGAK